MTEQEIKERAFNWAVDYKPWEEDLSPQEYAEYGFSIGALWARDQAFDGYTEALEEESRFQCDLIARLNKRYNAVVEQRNAYWKRLQNV